MSAVYLLFIVALIQGELSSFPILGFESPESCEEMKIGLLQQVAANEDSAVGVQGWCLKWAPEISKENSI